MVNRTESEDSDVPEGMTWPGVSFTVGELFWTTDEVVSPRASVIVAVLGPPAGAVLVVSSTPGYALVDCHCSTPWW